VYCQSCVLEDGLLLVIKLRITGLHIKVEAKVTNWSKKQYLYQPCNGILSYF